MDSEFDYAAVADDINSKDVAFIDVRTSEEYAAGHPQGAQNMPIDTITEETAAPLRDLRTVYVICGTGKRSEQACGSLSAYGVNTTNIPDGLSAWQEAGMSVEYGE